MGAGSIALGSSSAQAAEKKIDPRKPFKRISRFRDDLVTIGLVCGSRNSGHVGIWGQTWNPDEKHIRTTGMNCRYVWCLKDEIRNGRGPVTAASYMTPDWRNCNGVVTFEHEGPKGPYYGSLHEPCGANGNAYIRVFC